jgi:hypothetical protein
LRASAWSELWQYGAAIAGEQQCVQAWLVLVHFTSTTREPGKS